MVSFAQNLGKNTVSIYYVQPSINTKVKRIFHWRNRESLTQIIVSESNNHQPKIKINDDVQ